MNAVQRERKGILSLPGSLEEATSLMENSDLVGKVLGAHMHQNLVANQRKEWNDHRRAVRGMDIEDHLVTPYELNMLLPIL